MAVTLGSKNVGDIVKLKENGRLAEFIIVHKGIPGGYDASCSGVWVQRKYLYPGAKCGYNRESYPASAVNSWMENTYYNMFDQAAKQIIKCAKIPCSSGESIAVHCFALSHREMCSNIKNKSLTDLSLGTRLSYFPEDEDWDKLLACEEGGGAQTYFARGTVSKYGYLTLEVIMSYKSFLGADSGSWYLRPAMILDSGAVVNGDGTVTVNTAPSTPASISIPGSIRGGSTITVSWAASSDAQGNLEGYKAERSINGGAWTQIYQGGGTSITNNVAYGTNTVMYRVKAYDSEGLESGYKTSANVTVINNTAPGTPQGITVPADVRGGKPLTVSWGPSVDAENNLAGYELERSVDGGAWTQVYKNAQQSYTDSITFGWQTVAYRVRAYDAYNTYSGYATSEARAVDNNRPPEIACDFASGSDLGTKSEGFSVAYTVTDPDNNTGDVTVTETFNGAKKREFMPELGAVNAFAVEGTEFQCLPNGQHSISISAGDGKAASTHALTFTKSVTSALITLETPLEADDQITACAMAVSGHIPEDAKFRVLVTNNANDAEPKWENCTQMVKDGANYVFSNQTAENGHAFNFKITVSRGESGEGGYITSVQGGFQ